MINFNKYEQEEFDSYTKEQVYEAYLLEHQARIRIEQMLKGSETQKAALRYDRNKFEEKYFRELVKRTIEGSTDDDLDIFFKIKHEIMWVNKGYLGVMYIDSHIFIAFMYSGNSYSTMKSIRKILKGKEVFYKFHFKDYFKNNSTQINDMRKLVL